MSFYLYYSQREPESTVSGTWFTISPGHRIRGPSTSDDLREHAKSCAEVLCLANGWFSEDDGEGCIKMISVLGQFVAELRVTQKEVGIRVEKEEVQALVETGPSIQVSGVVISASIKAVQGPLTLV